MKPLAVMIADDHPIVRSAIKKTFQDHPDIIFHGEASNGKELLAMIENNPPDIAVIDLEMPEISGYEAILEIHTRHPQIKTIAFSGFLNPANKKRAMAMGACATVSKTQETRHLIEAIREVAQGNPYHCPMALDDFYVEPVLKNQDPVLTLREKQILELIGAGKTSRQISEIYNISQWTVDKHRSNIKEKLGLKNLAQIIRYAIENQ